VIDDVVAPVDHKIVPVQLLDVSITLPPLQIIFDAEFEVIEGGVITFTTTSIEFDFELIQLSLILH
jgi:hypothetical protein